LWFESEIKDLRVWIFAKEGNMVSVFSTTNKAAEFCGISPVDLGRHLKSGKLWNNKYYFSKTNSLI
jgi:hypothetical protein